MLNNVEIEKKIKKEHGDCEHKLIVAPTQKQLYDVIDKYLLSGWFVSHITESHEVINHTEYGKLYTQYVVKEN